MRPLIRDAQNYRAAVEIWKQGLPKETAAKILDDLREQTAQYLDKRAEAWTSENKLIHAGAAQKLANELRACK